MIGRYLNDCDEIYNKNRIRQYDLEIKKYWVTQSGYFRLAATVVLSMGIPDKKLLLCHGISEGSVEKKISTREYKNKTIYY